MDVAKGGKKVLLDGQWVLSLTMLCLEKKRRKGWVSSAQLTVGIFSAKVHLGRDWVLREDRLWADLPRETNKKSEPNRLLSRPWKLLRTRTGIPSSREFSLAFSQIAEFTGPGWDLQCLPRDLSPHISVWDCDTNFLSFWVRPTYVSILSESLYKDGHADSSLLSPWNHTTQTATIHWRWTWGSHSWNPCPGLSALKSSWNAASEAWGVGNFEGYPCLTFKS